MYRISFYGDRKPETMPDSRGKMIYEDFQKGELPARVEIRQGLIIEGRSIRDIEFIAESHSYQSQGLTSAELRNFELTKLSPFLNEHQELKPSQELAFLVSQGLIRLVMEDGKSYQTSSDATVYVKPHAIKEYTEMVDILEQWKVYAAKRSYAKRKELEHYEETASVPA